MPVMAHQRRCAALAAAIAEQGGLESACFMDLDALRATAAHIRMEAGYPSTALHTVAVKANPIGKVLEVFRDAGLGAEVASLGELAQALRVGFDPDHVVFDSPCKTVEELEYALQHGVRINLDNFQELERVVRLVPAHPEWLRGGQQLIGLRINPQVGAGSIAALSTGGAVSKFGFPLLEVRQQLVDAYVQHPWLNMLHLHVGSQGMPMSAIVDGVELVWQLLLEINAACAAAGGASSGAAAAGDAAGASGRVRVLDIGGGLTVDFVSDETPQVTRFQEQAALLRQRIPQLWDPACGVQLMTENGRSLLAKAGFVASRVEYTKQSGGRHIAVVHVGADLLMRACYLPDTWGLRVFVCDAAGAPKDLPAEDGADTEGPLTDVAGPLCFQGDRLAVARRLPATQPGDYVVVADTGAYTMSMYSRYNSRCAPPTYGYSIDPGSGAVQLRLLRAGETLQQVLAYWNWLG